jgi:MFS family permease
VRVIWTVHVVTFFFFFALGLTIPVLPLYLADLGLGAAWIGWAVGLMPLAGIFLRPLSGWASDGWSRKWPMVIGLVLSGLAGVFYLGALPLILLGRVLQGVGIALFAPSSLALTSDLAPAERLGGIMATRNLIVGLGLMAGSGAGGLLAGMLGYAAVFWAVALAQIIFLPALLRAPETLELGEARRWWQGYAATLAITPILAATLGSLGFAGVLAALQAYYPLILSEAGFSVTLVGAYFGFYGLVSVVFRLPAGWLIGRFGAGRVAFWGFMLALLGTWLLWAVPLPPVAFVAALLLGAGAGFYLPANLVAVSQSAPKEIRGSAFGLFTVSWDVGGLVGPVLGGAVAAIYGYGAVLPVAAAMAVFVVIGYVRLLGLGAVRGMVSASGD